MKDLTKTMDITTKEEEEMAQAQAKVDGKTAPQTTASTAPVFGPPPAYQPASNVNVTSSRNTKSTAPPTFTTTNPTTPQKIPPVNPYANQERPRGVPIRAALMERSEEDARLGAAGATDAEKDLRQKEKTKGLTRQQREELAAYEMERKRIRDERVDTLARKLIDRLSVWTETDKTHDVTKAFREKTRLEVENLKMESFGLEILHAIGATYLQKSTGFLKSQKLFGISGFWSRLKDKGTLAKETWGMISTAIDAQMSMEEMAKAEEKGGDDWTDEKKAELERRVTGRILAAAWKGSRFEIQSVLRDVCDKVLNDKHVKMEKRIERAEALTLMGGLFRDAKRDPDEEGTGDFMVFEQMMADAAVKREKKKETKETKEDGKRKTGVDASPASAPKPHKEGHTGHFGFGSHRSGEKSAS